jgi:NAD(P)H-dependent FMN reductase
VTSRFRVVGFSGSLRAGSSNAGLVHLAARIAAERGVTIDVVGDLDRLPFYNPDLESDLPAAATAWREAVEQADALVIGLPEYNFGPTGLAKNAIDWLTRPLGTHALRGKVVALLTSGGKGGGTRVQTSLGEIIGLLGNTVVDEPAITLAYGSKRIDGDGATDDQEIVDLVTRKVDNVIAALEAAAALAS